MQGEYHWAEDCPNCGEKDEHQQYKGARQGSSKWSHGYMCCSEECGLALKDSSKLIKLKLDAVNAEISGLKVERKYLLGEFKLRKSQGK